MLVARFYLLAYGQTYLTHWSTPIMGETSYNDIGTGYVNELLISDSVREITNNIVSTPESISVYDGVLWFRAIIIDGEYLVYGQAYYTTNTVQFLDDNTYVYSFTCENNRQYYINDDVSVYQQNYYKDGRYFSHWEPSNYLPIFSGGFYIITRSIVFHSVWLDTVCVDCSSDTQCPYFCGFSYNYLRECDDITYCFNKCNSIDYCYECYSECIAYYVDSYYEQNTSLITPVVTPAMSPILTPGISPENTLSISPIITPNVTPVMSPILTPVNTESVKSDNEDLTTMEITSITIGAFVIVVSIIAILYKCLLSGAKIPIEKTYNVYSP